MPSAREALLDAAYTALLTRAWTAVRMVEVAAAAGVSRQTLYNEFGGKDGLARALVQRETETYLAGVDRALARGVAGPADDAGARVAAAAAWTLRTARANPLVRAALTGCWGDRLPAGQDGPGELVGRFRDRAVAALAPGRPREELPALDAACETAARLTLSCVIAPASAERDPEPVRPPADVCVAVPRQRARRRPEAETEAVSRLVRGAFAGLAG
ncbi:MULTISPECIES: TetR/AcrR family transcriptional regulator [Streptomyces]|uniref:TetR/AcrR family transcriptional regulator n=1 Tax=Streptomyces yunnanensis TaxID=156453 RepID=A0ABY8A6E0_9ACTN|nr:MULTISPECIES: TetR/AcrR family transcriptional regulator [Streptomyces]AJC56080.1 TetR family transcriptional regulator [Streptomyces sp. 769]WEB40510.1 TetR/AcrR family transcriptional regulator [Streptomyces yunnanensis]